MKNGGQLREGKGLRLKTRTRRSKRDSKQDEGVKSDKRSKNGKGVSGRYSD